ncbi:MAG: hypothetical protein ACYC2U_07005 [Candidatus Amoebophilus sp.]
MSCGVACKDKVWNDVLLASKEQVAQVNKQKIIQSLLRLSIGKGRLDGFCLFV